MGLQFKGKQGFLLFIPRPCGPAQYSDIVASHHIRIPFALSIVTKESEKRDNVLS